MPFRGAGYTIIPIPPDVDGDLTLTNATGGDLTTTLTADKRYRNVTVNATSTGKQFIKTAARVMFSVSGTLTLTNSKCIIDASGADANQSTAGAGGVGTFSGTGGGTGANSSQGPGTVGTNISNPAIGGAGAGGGNATGGTSQTGGAGGTVTYTALRSYLNNLTQATGSLLIANAGTHPQTDTLSSIGAGSGGGGGSLSGTNGGGQAGGGGGGGGGIMIHAAVIDISGGGIIQANGGAGGTGSSTGNTDTNAGFGGGGGGGGGVVWLNYGELRQGTGQILASGGNKGSGITKGTGTAQNGTPGAGGKIILWSEFGVSVTTGAAGV
jgi:hypothetical protein